MILKMFALGLTAGVLSGMFGIGGGLVIVPALVWIFGFDIKTAVGTSLFVILLPTGLLGVWEYWKIGNLRIAAGLWIAIGLFCGAYFGAVTAGAVPALLMRRVYAAFLLVVAIYFLAAPPSDPAPQAEPGRALAALESGHDREGAQTVH
jgi:uncharacterized membrane protein YfcA